MIKNRGDYRPGSYPQLRVACPLGPRQYQARRLRDQISWTVVCSTSGHNDCASEGNLRPAMYSKELPLNPDQACLWHEGLSRQAYLLHIWTRGHFTSRNSILDTQECISSRRQCIKRFNHLSFDHFDYILFFISFNA